MFIFSCNFCRVWKFMRCFIEISSTHTYCTTSFLPINLHCQNVCLAFVKLNFHFVWSSYSWLSRVHLKISFQVKVWGCFHVVFSLCAFETTKLRKPSLDKMQTNLHVFINGITEKAAKKKREKYGFIKFCNSRIWTIIEILNSFSVIDLFFF